MGKWATKVLHRLPFSVLLLLWLALTLSVRLSVAVQGGDAQAVVGEGSFTFRYWLRYTDFENLFSSDTATLGSLFILVAMCFILPATQLLFAFCACLCAAVIMVAMNFALPVIDNQVIGVNRQLISLLAVFLAFLLGREIILLLRRRRVYSHLRHYMPSQLFQHYMQHPEDISVGGESRNMTIMFCDIKRFTAISERLDPELLPEWLNRYFDAVSEVVVAHGGTIDKYIGDSVMAFWGAPARSETHAYDALKAAKEILEVLEKLSDQLVDEGWPAIAVGIGISTGNANVGHLGSRQRMTYTVVGDAVNTADRLQRCTSAYNLSLVVNDAATENVPEFLFRELDTVHVKGRQRFVRIFQPICHQDDAIPNTHRQLQLHRKAMQFYRRGMWEDAEKLFRLLSDETNEVGFYRMYIERMVNIQKSDPADGTNYIVDFTQKIG